MGSDSSDVSTYQSNITKKRHSPAELKAIRHASPDAVKDKENTIILPEPDIRQVPVNVTRRTASQVVPLPPPSNQQQGLSKAKSRVSNRRSKRRVNGGTGSGSDSDEEQPTRVIEAESSRNDQNKRSHENEVAERQMEARLKQENEDVEWQLIDFRQKYHDRPPINKTVIYHEEKLHEYLEECVPEHWESNPTKFLTSRHEVLEDIIQRVETVVLRQCSRFDDLASSDDSQSLRLACVLGRVLRALLLFWPFVTRYEDYKSTVAKQEEASPGSCSDTDNIASPGHWTDVLRRFGDACRIASPTDLVRPFRINDIVVHTMVDRFWDRIIFAMCKASMSVPMHEAIDTSLFETIGQSRQNERLTSSYIDWMTDGVDTSMLEDAIDKWYTTRWTTSDRTRAAREGPVKKSETRVLPNFRSDSTEPPIVSLVLPKLAEGIKRTREVSEEELADLGWHRETQSVGFRECAFTLDGNGMHGGIQSGVLWRCEPAGDGREILKVDMNGIILGVFGLKRGASGAQWWDWVFVGVGVLRERPSGRYWNVRGVSKSEAHALGLPMVGCEHESEKTACIGCLEYWYGVNPWEI